MEKDDVMKDLAIWNLTEKNRAIRSLILMGVEELKNTTIDTNTMAMHVLENIKHGNFKEVRRGAFLLAVLTLANGKSD